MNERILVVDDDGVVREALVEYLTRRSLAVEGAATGAEALRRIEAAAPDLVLLDIVLEDTNGIDLLREIRARRPALPVIVVTGFGSVHGAADALRLGASDYILKPCDPEIVFHQVRSVLAAHRLREAQIAERQVQMAMRLAEGICHHFNNQLTAVTGYSLLLSARQDLSPDVAACLSHIARAGTRMSELVAKLGSFCRVGGGARQDVALLPVLREIVLTYALRHQTRIDLRLDGMPAGLTVQCQPPQLVHLFSELIANACEATPAGGSVVVSGFVADEPLAPTAAGQSCSIVVEDLGPSLPAEDDSALIEPFFLSGEGFGRGMGLTVARSIAASCGGSLALVSRAGGGVCARVTLPVRCAEEMPPAAATAPAAGAAVSGTVLVVDDEEAVRDVLAHILEGERLTPLIVSGSREAAALIDNAAQPIDTVLLDAFLPRADGRALHQGIRRARPRARVIFMSGSPPTGEVLDILRTDRNAAFLPKPFTVDQLREALRRTEG